MKNGLIVGGAALAIGFAMWAGWAMRGIREPEPAPRSERLDVEQSVSAGERTPGGSANPTSLESPAERAARISAQRQAQRDTTRASVAAGKRNLEASFGSEKANPSWARGKEQELERYAVNPQMDAIGAIPTDFNVECRTSTCRIEAGFATSTAADDWVTLYLTNNGGALPRTSLSKVPQPDGSVKLIMVGSTQ